MDMEFIISMGTCIYGGRAMLQLHVWSMLIFILLPSTPPPSPSLFPSPFPPSSCISDWSHFVLRLSQGRSRFDPAL